MIDIPIIGVLTPYIAIFDIIIGIINYCTTKVTKYTKKHANRGRATLSTLISVIYIPIIGVLTLYIANFDIKIGSIGSHIFPKLKLSFIFNNFPPFGKDAQFLLDCFNKTFTSNCYGCGVGP